jgi:O-methyltransferase involved in polyketide biosynthesis
MTALAKDYSTISPSAKTLLWMKALTDIPFAREAARLVFGDPELPKENDERVTPNFLKRLLHFDVRYWSIDAALEMMALSNILEISSGFSFRGLHQVQYEDRFYIDTDLPEVIHIKETLLQPILRTLPEAPLGQLLVKPLNALDEDAFRALVRRFPPGPLALVNEGLLVYLDESEKRRLCAIIRALLKERGGYWVTADVYVRKMENEMAALSEVTPDISKFLADHHVNENKFGSFGEAEAFFLSCGLKLAYKAGPDLNRLRSRELLRNKGQQVPQVPLVQRHRIRETWILEPHR